LTLSAVRLAIATGRRRPFIPDYIAVIDGDAAGSGFVRDDQTKGLFIDLTVFTVSKINTDMKNT
jgi:hypothetical protein